MTEIKGVMLQTPSRFVAFSQHKSGNTVYIARDKVTSVAQYPSLEGLYIRIQVGNDIECVQGELADIIALLEY